MRTRTSPTAACTMGSTLRPVQRAASLLVAACAFLALSPAAQAVPQDRPDKVVRQGSRGRTTDVTGEITENTLTGLKIKVRGNEQRIDAEDVVSIRWGEVPASFTAGRDLLQRGDYENAVSRLREAAGDDEARDVVRAAARLMAAEALMAWGRIDTGRFQECADECDRFLADHGDNRETPRAEWLKARATRLAGDPAGAATLFQALHQKGSDEPGTPGYPRELCMDAGLQAADCLLAAGKAGEARSLYQALEGQLAGLAAGLEDASPAQLQRISAMQAEAACGEGFCLLAEGKLPQAGTFFEGRVEEPAEMAPATLGLALVRQAQGELRAAQIAFARVSASDHRSRDRVARALVGLAETTRSLGDSNAPVLSRAYLTDVRERFGDTPAALRAVELLGQ